MKILTAVAIAALFLVGCAKKNQTPEAIRQGVIRDISKSFKMDSMDITVDSVSFRDKEADATVTFGLKGGQPGQGMHMKYLMEQHSDGEWYIKSRAAAGEPEGAAGGSGSMPAGHPALGAPPAGGDAAGTLPPDHPPIGQKQ